jgi:hypothetical protein
MNFCMCGAEAGYGHASDCPFPLFNCRDPKRQEQWERAREQLASIADELPGESRYAYDDE